MKKIISLVVLALLMTAGTAISCSSDDEKADEPKPITPTDNIERYQGWTWGSNEYAGFIPSDGDSLLITPANANYTLCSITYKSETWGTATLDDVRIVKNDTAYLFLKPITASIRDDHSAWDFSAAVDSIAMPNRNPQAGTVTVKNYPIVLTSACLSLDKTRWQFDFDTYLVPRSEHVQHISFRNGHTPSMN